MGESRILRYQDTLQNDLKLVEISDDIMEELMEDRCVVPYVAIQIWNPLPAPNRAIVTLLPLFLNDQDCIQRM